MGNEIGTVAGAIGTAGTAVAAAATLGQVDAVNRAVVATACYTAEQSRNTTVRHVGEGIGLGAATVGCAVASAATLGQVEAVNSATASMAAMTGNSAEIAVLQSVDDYNPFQLAATLSKIGMSGYTRDLPSMDILLWLVTKASQCYHDEPQFTIPSVVGGNCGESCLYTMDNGDKCMAIRGTENLAKGVTDIGLFVAGELLISMIQELTEVARSWGVKYVTGHSLGGFLAEAVASRLGLDGASFNSPGGRGCLAFGTAWTTDTRFEVHLNGGDWVSSIRIGQHIADPKWHYYQQGADPAIRHNIDEMKDDIQKMLQPKTMVTHVTYRRANGAGMSVPYP